MKKLFVLALLLLTVGCASVPRARYEAAPTPPPYAQWQRVLERFVDSEGRVNFDAATKDRADLDSFVAYVNNIAPNNHPELFPTREAALAFHINAYNALAMHKVIHAGIPQTLAGARKVGFFYASKVYVGGQDISLYDYENKVIRAFNEPRIHVTLNCMSVSCPRLPRDVFTPEKLEAQLTREAELFFSEPRNVAVNDAAKTITLSEILKFYTEDFLAHAPTLAAYVNRYRTSKIPETHRVLFFDYDWTINRQP